MPGPDDVTRAPDSPASTPWLADPGTTSGAAQQPPGAGRYLLEEVARGGMGVVYRAADVVLGREVAVKVLQDRFGPASSAARRFTDEARITAQLQHPNIPAVHDLGTLPDGRPFLVMKLIKGSTLEARLAARPDPSHDRSRFVAAFEKVCEAVAYAHAHGVIHRDLKPANVMVGAFGEVQVMDWGLAKVLGPGAAVGADPEETSAGTQVLSLREADGAFTQAGSVLGTPAYMPPEQAIGAVAKVDARSDVFGLGGILAAVLTGQPPFAASSAETTRGKAARGKVDECFARLDSSGADPELVALCKRCLAPEKDDRPADAGEVGRAVASLRAAADERARQAELDRVKAEGEKATAEARALERRRRRRVWAGALTALALAVIGGLSAVLAVQDRARRDLEAKNAELAEEQEKVEARFELARKAVAAFHTGVSEDVLLKNEQFAELRTRLLKEAARFYADLEKLLAGQTDVKSRTALAEGYFRLANLTWEIGAKPEALQAFRKALTIQQQLAEAYPAVPEHQIDLAVSLHNIGLTLSQTGKPEEALAAYRQALVIQQRVAEANPAVTDNQGSLAGIHDRIGLLLAETGKPKEALRAYRQALDIRLKLADEYPTVAAIHTGLAGTLHNIGIVLDDTWNPEGALRAFRQAVSIQQRLADANPTVRQYQTYLANHHDSIGNLLSKTGKPEGALAAYRQALGIRQRLADANPAVTDNQGGLAGTHSKIGLVLSRAGKPEEALQSYQRALVTQRKLADANPTVTQYQGALAATLSYIGDLRSRTGKPEEALAAYRQALVIQQKLADANPTVTRYQSALAATLNEIGLLLGQTERQEEALAACRKALVIRQQLADANPAVAAFQSDQAGSFHNVGLALIKAGKSREALESFRRAVVIQQRVAKAYPSVTQYQTFLANHHESIANLLSQTGKSEEALAAHLKALSIRQRLSDASPTNTDFRSYLAGSHNNIGDSLVMAGKPAEALPAFQKALAIYQKLADDNPAITDFRSGLALSLTNLGRAHARQRRFTDAFAALDRGQALHQTLAHAQPSNFEYSNSLGLNHAYRGAARARAGQPKEAATDLRRALQLWDRDKAHTAEFRFERAQALAMLAGLGRNAKSGVTAQEAAAYSDRAVEALRDAIDAGWARIDLLKEPEFDSVRGREDFQKLVKKLEAKAAGPPEPKGK